MTKFWISCPKFTIRVYVHDGIIVKAAPIVQKFINQPVVNLLNWAAKFGKVIIKEKPE
jgi:hypothetical protein